ncbi:hypothetical protein HDU99_001687, partial [Rhizoclosmatium hyalinum]
VLDFNNNGYSDPATGNPAVCGNYAYVLQKIKKNNPNLKFLISVGGWYDSNLFSAATEPKYIDKFVTSIVEFVKFFGFDGVDFDWEYPGWEHGGQAIPGNPGGAGAGNAEDTRDCLKTTCAYPARSNDKAKFTAMVSKVRSAFNAAGKTPSGSNFLISMAAGIGADKMDKLDIKSVCENMDFINLMAYDVHGEWESNTNHQAALYDDTPPQYQNNNGVAQTSIDFAVNYYINNGCPANQVVVGVPFYGHAWGSVEEGGSHGLFQKGLAPSSTLKTNYVNIAADTNVQTFWDATAQASYGYSPASKVFWSYDTAQAISVKVGYGAQKGLGGFMVWPIDGDDSKSTLLNALTGPGTPPGPPPSGSSTTAAAQKTTTTTVVAPKTTTTAAVVQTTTAPVVQTTTAAVIQTTTAAVVQTTTAAVVQTTTAAVKTTTAVIVQTTTTSASSGQTPCVAPYDATKTYLKGDQASEGGFNYVANWYALNNDPAANSAPYSQWTNLGACGGTGPVVTTAAPTTTAVQQTTTAAVPKTTTAAVQQTTTVAAPKTTTAVAPITTTAAAGGKISNGASCTTFGAWGCSNACICNYVVANGANVLQWQCTPTSASC